MLRSKLSLFCLTILLLTACSRAQPTATPIPTAIAQATLPPTTTYIPQPTATQTPTSIPTVTKTAAATMAQSVTPQPKATPAQIPTVTLTPSPTITPLFYTTANTTGTDQMLAWLAANYTSTDLAEIKAMLIADNWQAENDTVLLHEVTGDDQPELFVSLRLQGKPLGFDRWPGDLFILNKQGVLFASGGLNPSEIETFADFTDNGIDNVVIRDTLCGMSGCWYDREVIGIREDGRLANLVWHKYTGPTEYENFESTVISTADNVDVYIRDDNGDGLTNYVLHYNYVYGGNGFGVARGSTQVWGWDAGIGRITLLQSIPAPLIFINHAVYDANDRAAEGNIEAAIAMYYRVIHDDAFKLWISNENQPAVFKSFRLFSAFRLAVLHLLKDDVAGATIWLQWVQRNHPNSTYNESLQTLIDTWQQTQSIEDACAIAVVVVQADPDAMNINMRLMGDGNSVLTYDDLCPEANQ